MAAGTNCEIAEALRFGVHGLPCLGELIVVNKIFRQMHLVMAGIAATLPWIVAVITNAMAELSIGHWATTAAGARMCLIVLRSGPRWSRFIGGQVDWGRILD